MGREGRDGMIPDPLEPMTDEEQSSYIEYATKFGHSWGNRLEWLREDLVSAALHGAAIAFASAELPKTRDERRKFVGQACWNMMRREMTRFRRLQPVAFTDIAQEYRVEHPVVPEHVARIDWLDEYETIATALEPRTEGVFRLSYGDEAHTQTEISEKLGISVSAVRHQLKKIKRIVQRRHEREERLG